MKSATKKATKKKATNAVTLLTRIETLLSDVLDQCVGIEKSVEKNAREVLGSAQKSISSAIDYFSVAQSSEVPKKTAKKAKPSVKAKKRSTTPVAKKRAVNA